MANKAKEELSSDQIDRGIAVSEKLSLRAPTLVEQAERLNDEANSPTTLSTQRINLRNEATFLLLLALARSNEEVVVQLQILNGEK